ncbi:MAG: endonuclease III [Desulfamplus sp.]|nr:endonuclease III [Desulfamplus sp.]
MHIDISLFLEKLREEIKNYKVPVVELISIQTRDPFKVLVATILSARTKDETTAKASERLFKAAPDPDALAMLSQEQIKKFIYPVGFYKTKAGYLSKLPNALKALKALKKFKGDVPQELDDLLTLPGVGRKTASLVLNVAFQKDAICVDTHVHRIMNIWNYVNTRTPLETEMALRKKLPLHYWQEVNTILVTFGQGTCHPVSPHCDRCVLLNLCPQKGVKPRKKHL